MTAKKKTNEDKVTSATTGQPEEAPKPTMTPVRRQNKVTAPILKEGHVIKLK